MSAPVCVAEFGNRRAVYAASGGIWAIYFAVLDRERYVPSLINACPRIVNQRGHRMTVIQDG